MKELINDNDHNDNDDDDELVGMLTACSTERFELLGEEGMSRMIVACSRQI